MAIIFGDNLKTAFLKGMESLGKTASNLAEGARQKLNEMNLETRRREILSEIPKCVDELYQQGIELPEKLNALLNELKELDEKLSAMHPQPTKEESETEKEAPTEPAGEEASEEACECAEESCACEELPIEETAPAEETPATEDENGVNG